MMKDIVNFQMKSKIKYIFYILIFSLIVFIVITRFSRIEADPDCSISLSKGAYINDEGWKSGNVINKFITNKWLCDDHNDILLWPVMPLMEYVSFKIFGLSLFSIRLPAIIFSTFLIFLIAIFLFISCNKLEKNNRLKVLTLYLFLAATNYYLFIQGRIAFFDIPMSTLGFISLIFLNFSISSRKLRKKYTFFFLIGIFLGLCICTKTTGLLFFVTSLITILIRKS